jgi:di/tricarboxylate transporter
MLEIDSPEHTFYEAVIGSGSRLVGRTLAGIGFRGTYQAAVLAIHRAGGRIDRGLGRISLEAGDTLILLAGPDFQRRSRRNKDFLVIARLGGPPPSSTRRAPLVALVAVAIVGLAAFDVFPILQLALAGAGILIATRTITFSEAGQAIDFGVILLIAAAFGVGAAIEVTGLAEQIAEGLLDLFGDFGNLGILFGIALATLILTEVITNNAAVIVIFPIALAVSTAAGLDPRIVTIMVAVIASASFLTPMGYQTNTMVYGPGGYRFSDYLRAGFPLTIVVLGAVTLVSWQLA